MKVTFHQICVQNIINTKIYNIQENDMDFSHSQTQELEEMIEELQARNAGFAAQLERLTMRVEEVEDKLEASIAGMAAMVEKVNMRLEETDQLHFEQMQSYLVDLIDTASTLLGESRSSRNQK